MGSGKKEAFGLQARGTADSAAQRSSTVPSGAQSGVPPAQQGSARAMPGQAITGLSLPSALDMLAGNPIPAAMYRLARPSFP
jgi:hypothetical protein